MMPNTWRVALGAGKIHFLVAAIVIVAIAAFVANWR